MAKVVVTATVKDGKAWEAAFRTHGDIFRDAYGVTSPIGIAINDGNQVAVCFEPADLDKMMAAVNSPFTAETMEADGVDRASVKIYVMDREFQL